MGHNPQKILILLTILAVVGCAQPHDNLQVIPPATLAVPVVTPSISLIPAETSPTLSLTPTPHLPTALPSEITLSAPPTSQAFTTYNRFGFTINPLNESGGLNQLIQSGGGWTRHGFRWSEIEPSPKDRIWNASLDSDIIQTVSAGVQLIMLIENTPSWALKPGFTCGPVAQDKFPALADFLFDLVNRYSAPPFNIHYWELWNEPDAAGLLGCWGDPSDPEYYGGYYYGQMLQAVYPRIKQADLQAQVLVGGLLLDCDPNSPPPGKDCTPSRFLKGVLESGAGTYFDGVSFHAYDYYYGGGAYGNPNWSSTSGTTGPVLITKANYLRDLLHQYGYDQKYLMSTETALFYGPNIDEPPCDPNAPPDIDQAEVQYLIESYSSALSQDLKVNLWYAALGGRCAGLLNPDLSPKPAFNAYRDVQQRLGNAVYVRQITEYSSVMGYAFVVDGVHAWVLWSLNGYPNSIILPSMPSLIERIGNDGMPKQEPNQISITIDNAPVYVKYTH